MDAGGGGSFQAFLGIVGVTAGEAAVGVTASFCCCDWAGAVNLQLGMGCEMGSDGGSILRGGARSPGPTAATAGTCFNK